jgi:hypothetical protein
MCEKFIILQWAIAALFAFNNASGHGWQAKQFSIPTMMVEMVEMEAYGPTLKD